MVVQIPEESVVKPYRQKTIPRKPKNVKAVTCLSFTSWWTEDQENSDLNQTDFVWQVQKVLVIPMIECTCFKEENKCLIAQVGGGQKKRYIKLMFDLRAKQFHARITSDDQSIGIHNLLHVKARNGTALGPWDLHVGAKLDILGKQVLMSSLKENKQKINCLCVHTSLSQNRSWKIFGSPQGDPHASKYWNKPMDWLLQDEAASPKDWSSGCIQEI